MGALTVGDLACGRAGDKASVLDMTLVAADGAGYEAIAQTVTAEVVGALFGGIETRRYELPRLRALKFVLLDALDAGPLASRHAGVHWQKTAISALLALELAGSPRD
jgi:hypothetical protein